MRGIGKRLASVGVVAALALALVTACSGNGTTTAKSAANAKSTRSASHGGSASASASPNGPTVTITPGNGSENADPSAGITVTAARGTLQSVTVRTSGDPVSGSLSRGGTVWHSQWTLGVSQSYTVTATASWHGTTSTTTSSFRTLTPARTFSTEILEGAGQSYGVGMPIILYFSQQITDKAAVERALQVSTSKPVIGAWYWDEPCNMAASCAYFRPRDYWPAGTTVSFTGRLDGVQVEAGPHGSTFVSPSALPPDTAKAPLQTAAAGNAVVS